MIPANKQWLLASLCYFYNGTMLPYNECVI